MRLALFITCLADTFYPRAGIAVVKVLEKLGHEVVFPKAQTCCGQPMWNNGFADETRALAKKLIETFEPYDHVVTPSGSCAAMIRDYYTEMFEPDEHYPGEPEWHERAKKLASKTREFVELLANDLKVDLGALGCKWEGKVTYHYSCHLRGIGMTDEASRLMKQIPGLDLVPLEKQEQCCGFGGTFAMKYPDISGSMVRDKVSCIRKTEAPTVVSNDSGCTMNIAGACRREGVEVQLTSLAEIIAEGFGLIDKLSPEHATVTR